MKLLLIVAISLCLVITSFGQNEGNKSDLPKPDRWRGLIIDEATPDDALKLLGKPKKDKIDSLPVLGIHDRLTKNIKQKKYRVLSYEKPEDLDFVMLGFLDDKLVFIKLDPRKLPTSALINAYNVDFEPSFGEVRVAFDKENYERADNGKLYPKIYPMFYDLIAISEKTLLCAAIDNSGYGSFKKNVIGVRDSTVSFPGKVSYLQIVSRKLENLDGIDQLK